MPEQVCAPKSPVLLCEKRESIVYFVIGNPYHNRPASMTSKKPSMGVEKRESKVFAVLFQSLGLELAKLTYYDSRYIMISLYQQPEI